MKIKNVTQDELLQVLNSVPITPERWSASFVAHGIREVRSRGLDEGAYYVDRRRFLVECKEKHVVPQTIKFKYDEKKGLFIAYDNTFYSSEEGTEVDEVVNSALLTQSVSYRMSFGSDMMEEEKAFEYLKNQHLGKLTAAGYRPNNLNLWFATSYHRGSCQTGSFEDARTRVNALLGDLELTIDEGPAKYSGERSDRAKLRDWFKTLRAK